MKIIYDNIALLVFIPSAFLLIFWPVVLLFGLPPMLGGSSSVAHPFEAFVRLLNYWGGVFYPVIVILAIFLMIKNKEKYKLVPFLPMIYLAVIVLTIRLITLL